MCIHVKIKLQFYFILLLQFFLPNFPSRIEFGYSSGGQMSRIADVEFKTHRQAVEALKRNNSFMCKSRVISYICTGTRMANFTELLDDCIYIMF